MKPKQSGQQQIPVCVVLDTFRLCGTINARGFLELLTPLLLLLLPGHATHGYPYVSRLSLHTLCWYFYQAINAELHDLIGNQVWHTKLSIETSHVQPYTGL